MISMERGKDIDCRGVPRKTSPSNSRRFDSAENTAVTKLLQYSNADLPIVTTDPGIRILFRLHHENDPGPIRSTRAPSAKTTSSRLWQFANDNRPRDSTDAGMEILLKLEPMNAVSSILCSREFDSNATVSSSFVLLKQAHPIASTVSRIRNARAHPK
jgi:hypothetical protein